MAQLEIKKYGDPVLRKKAEEVKEITEDIKKLIEDMIPTMEKADGVGLAAPQVGVSKRVIVVQTEKGALPLINPRILKKGNAKTVMEEGCLSLPGVWLKIKRAKEVEVQALDREGKKAKIKAEGLSARIFQHEVDHLNGILIINRINIFQRLNLKKKLSEIKAL